MVIVILVIRLMFAIPVSFVFQDADIDLFVLSHVSLVHIVIHCL